jgi:CelD/BcsL family acetyltransferase involved in cellulose biosynthesis
VTTGRIEATVSTNLEELAPRFDEWRKLAVGVGSMFVTPEWTTAWFETYSEDFEPSIRSVTHNGRLVALMPLMKGSDGGLRFVGDGVGDIFAPLVAPDAPAGALDALVGTLRTHPGKLLILTNVERGAAWRRTLKQDLGFAGLADRETVLPYLALDGLDWPGFLATRSANLRSQLGRKMRVLEHSHTVASRITESAVELSLDLASLFDLHDRRWAPRGGSGSSSFRMRSFLASLCARALDEGWLRLWTLEVDGRAAAALLGWRVGFRYSYYLAGFDAEYSDQSPGLLLLARTVESAMEEGASEYDFLLGNEEYKSRFANASREVETEILGPPRSAHLAVVRLDRTLRRVGRRLPAPARKRIQSAAARFQSVLPLSRQR